MQLTMKKPREWQSYLKQHSPLIGGKVVHRYLQGTIELKHLAIGVDDIDEAQNLLERKGWKFREDTRVVKDGQTVAIYLEREIAGFAIHLLQRK